MLNVGLTGGIASGKSTVARMFAEKGAVLIDLDEIAHAVEEPGGDVWRRLVSHFGERILCADRTIDRRKLGTIVFSERNELACLNEIVHPTVLAVWKERLRQLCKRDPETIAMSGIPLLIESGMEKMVDLVVLVYLSPEKQLARLMEREGYSRREAEMRIAAQMPIEKKLPYADIVIRNDGFEEETREQIEVVWEELERRVKETTFRH